MLEKRRENAKELLFMALSCLSLVLSFFRPEGLILPFGYAFDWAWVAIILCGLPIIKGALEGLIREFDIKADVLVSIALVAAVLIGEIFAAGEVALIMTLGAFLEERTVAKARRGIERLVQLTPPTARVVAQGETRLIPVEAIEVGQTLRVLAGETIPADGIILQGETAINQAVMTGESLPVEKGAGDSVISGTVNQLGPFDMEATQVGENSSLQRMIRLVASADAGKAKIVRLADRWATWIVVTALLSAAGTWFLTGEAIRAVTILVVFCPCALVLATPTAIMAGIGNSTQYGILVREGDALERLARVSHMAFDKTGTLTQGQLSVIQVKSFDPAVSEEALLALTAAAESRSEHPVGQAIAAHYRELAGPVALEPEAFSLLPGRGVEAVVSGKKLLAGNMRLMEERGFTLEAEKAGQAAAYLNQGATVILVALQGALTGFIALADTLRPETTQTVKQLRQLGLITLLLTGDHGEAAAQAGKEAGIAAVYAECLPEDKLSHIDAHHQRGQRVCMIGDGINDAPALKKAYVGIAMGGIGSDIAVDAADLVLVSDEIKWLPHLFGLARKTMRTIHWNIALSLALNFAAILLAMTGILTPVLGALVHNVGSVVVIINSSRLLHWKASAN